MTPFREAFIIKVRNVPEDNYTTSIILPNFEFYGVLVENADIAEVEALRLARELGVHAVNLCGGFTNEEVGRLGKILGEHVGLFVARGDVKSSKIVEDAIKNSLG